MEELGFDINGKCLQLADGSMVCNAFVLEEDRSSKLRFKIDQNGKVMALNFAGKAKDVKLVRPAISKTREYLVKLGKIFYTEES